MQANAATLAELADIRKHLGPAQVALSAGARSLLRRLSELTLRRCLPHLPGDLLAEARAITRAPHYAARRVCGEQC